MFYKRTKQKTDKALKHADKLKVDIEQCWSEDWFNQTVSALPNHIRVDFENNTHYNLPLTLLNNCSKAA